MDRRDLLLLLATSRLRDCRCHLWLPAATATAAAARNNVVCNAATVAACRHVLLRVVRIRHNDMLRLLLRLR